MADRFQLLIYHERIENQISELETVLDRISEFPPENINGSSFIEWENFKKSLETTIALASKYSNTVIKVIDKGK